ncbi:hypothetical protein QT196_07300 [Streptomyces sp. P9-2B-2]|uniref:hypothetical protein n=1 Tax=Streptomyces sp. P9-2B-2 TaxID=3057114 RepID=UPI0025B49BC7|nr:hypothetical protein [Streptomyces sp. P9-2B-2]WJY37100.1 hypothetical protein QT196_07300 [Streptomyces sp. P9-2B-2]
MRAYVDAFGLLFGAFDFAVRADGRWIWLETNPNGQWAFVDEPTRRAITTALADHLQNGIPHKDISRPANRHRNREHSR